MEANTTGELRFLLPQLQAWVEKGLSQLGDRKDGGPIRELHLELTHRCNLKCIMCHHWEMPFRDPASVQREMGLAEIRKLVAESNLLQDVRTVVLTGGEPWLRTDIVDIVAFLSGHYPRASIGVLTNFWNTEMVRRRLREIRERGVRNLWLGSSLDGLEDTHDNIRGQKGSFKGLVETAGMMRREFPDIHFSFSFTITPKNFRELWPTYRFVTEDLGLWFGAQMVVNHQGLQAPETFQWKEEELAEVEGHMNLILADIARREGALARILQGREHESLGTWTRLLYWWHLRKYARRPERFFKDCMAGQRYAMFDPEGNLFFCPVNKHRTIGNVRQRSFDEVWTSEKARSERGYVDSCRCDCWLNCIANPILDRLMERALSTPAGGN